VIFVDRSKVAVPEALLGESSLGVKERKSNANRVRLKQPLAFNAYGHLSVRAALDELFMLKCAYCEANVGATEIEHFRPKGNVWVWEVVQGAKRQKSVHDLGYWWLAAEWSNLFLACTSCNERRRQLMPDGTYEVLGKACFFPIADEAQRAKLPNRERHEAPLLLNPCNDDPSKHLLFLADGHVKPAKRGAQARLAEETIEACGLAKGILKAARAAQANWWKLTLGNLERAYRTRDQEGIVANLKQLEVAMAANSPFSGFARQFIRPELLKLRRKLRAANASPATASRAKGPARRKATPSRAGAARPKRKTASGQSKRTKVKTRSGG
jgi:uncharacterized protein (TIGR02646 family)